MKILIVPDVHGRDFWIEPCSHIDEFDKVIFLGDYHDPYPFQVSAEKSRHMLRDIVAFVENNKDKVICLLGNHDANYIYYPTSNRFDKFHQKEIRNLLNKLDLQLAYKEDNYIFSHSGILPGWLKFNNLTLEDVLNNNVRESALMQISPNRGGDDNYGSCIWGDASEYRFSKKLPDYYQIFGHSQLQSNPIITDKFACLDIRKCFLLDTDNKIIFEYESKSN
jgi:hypothetical protein